MLNIVRTFLATAFLLVLICAAEVLGQWQHYGLENRRVRSLEFDRLTTSEPGLLYACTDSGLYRIQAGLPASLWYVLGLAGKSVTTCAVIDRPLLIAGLESGPNLIYRSNDNGLNWYVSGAGFGGSDPFTVAKIDASPDIPNNYRYVLACGGGDLGKSLNQGGSFFAAGGAWGYFGGFNFVKMDSLQTNVAYAGGMSAYWGPLLMKTTDTGKTWTLLMEGYGVPANPAYDIVIHPTSPDTVWLAIENCIAKSNDGGYHWTTFCAVPTFRFRTVEIDQKRPNYLYASGGYAPGLLTLFYSRDGGATWNSISDTVQLQDPVTDIVLTAPDSVTNRIYIATERGVFRYSESVPYVGCCTGERGNVNEIGIVDLADLSALVSYLTGGGYEPTCKSEANLIADGMVDLADLSALVNYLTGGGYVLPPCPE